MVGSPLRIAVVVAALVVATACTSESAVEQSAQPEPAGDTQSDANEAATDVGELIAFERAVAGAEEPDLYAVAPDGGEPRLLRSPGGYPHWSPDGSQLAFTACLNPPDCTTALALLERATGDVNGFPFPDQNLFTACAIWAPSGTRLACEGVSEGDPTRNGVYSIRASDGQGLTRITRNPGGDDIPLTYSPDGRQLLFAREDRSRSGPANQALFVTPISGGQPHRITPWGFTDDLAGWSPDGRTIVFGTNGFLYRVSPNGRGLAKIRLQTADSAAATTAFDVSFSPDGTRIVFSVGSAPGIYTARVDGTDVQRVTSSPTEDHHASWGATSSDSKDATAKQLIGLWHRAQTCAEMLTVFNEAGLAESHREWLQGNFYGGKPGPKNGDPCAGAEGPLEHDHFFTSAGAFGSHDQNGEEVDSGDFEVVDKDTVSFPSHAAEFGYHGDLVVGYSVSGDVVAFDVALPEPCTDTCADAYAWALSAFASGTWQRGAVPQ